MGCAHHFRLVITVLCWHAFACLVSGNSTAVFTQTTESTNDTAVVNATTDSPTMTTVTIAATEDTSTTGLPLQESTTISSSQDSTTTPISLTTASTTKENVTETVASTEHAPTTAESTVEATTIDLQTQPTTTQQMPETTTHADDTTYPKITSTTEVSTKTTKVSTTTTKLSTQHTTDSQTPTTEKTSTEEMSSGTTSAVSTVTSVDINELLKLKKDVKDLEETKNQYIVATAILATLLGIFIAALLLGILICYLKNRNSPQGSPYFLDLEQPVHRRQKVHMAAFEGQDMFRVDDARMSTVSLDDSDKQEMKTNTFKSSKPATLSTNGVPGNDSTTTTLSIENDVTEVSSDKCEEETKDEVL